MRTLALLSALILIAPVFAEPSISELDPNFVTADAEKGLNWVDVRAFGLENQGWTDVEAPFDRLPAKAKGVAPDAVWRLSKHSAGLAVRFQTNATSISARWTLTSEDLAMPHMAATGVSGLDLYARDDEGAWRWVANGRPASKSNDITLISGIPEGRHEYMLYLPLYNGVESVALGFAKDSEVGAAPGRPTSNARPIVFYGTSITQGGCASRTGMAHPAIVGRMLDRPAINLGFSGNGKMEPEMISLIAELDPAVFVLECLPNMNADLVLERLKAGVETLRAAHPDTPIVLVENIEYQAGWFRPDARKSYEDKNAALQQRYAELLAEGVTGLFYVKAADLLGPDSAGTVDGTHPTDLGFLRIAEGLEPVLRKALQAN